MKGLNMGFRSCKKILGMSYLLLDLKQQGPDGIRVDGIHLTAEDAGARGRKHMFMNLLLTSLLLFEKVLLLLLDGVFQVQKIVKGITQAEDGVDREEFDEAYRREIGERRQEAERIVSLHGSPKPEEITQISI